MKVTLDIMDQCDTKIDHIIIYRSVTYISWSIDFALYLENYLVDEGSYLRILDQYDTQIDLIKYM